MAHISQLILTNDHVLTNSSKMPSTNDCPDYIISRGESPRVSSLNEFFWWWIFVILWKLFWKKNILSQISFLFFKWKKLTQFVTIAYNMKGGCLIYFYFHILNVTKFGEICLWIVTTWATSQNWKTKSLESPLELNRGTSIIFKTELELKLRVLSPF